MEKLGEAGAFVSEETDFYLWNTSPYNWPNISYQSRSVVHNYNTFLNYFTLPTVLPPQYWALGDFTINAIPKGHVKPLGKGQYEVCVNKMYYFINDIFNFEGWSYLSSWDWNQNFENPVLQESYFLTPFFNSELRQFRRHGYVSYFPVLSKLHELENFTPWCKTIPYEK